MVQYSSKGTKEAGELADFVVNTHFALMYTSTNSLSLLNR